MEQLAFSVLYWNLKNKTSKQEWNNKGFAVQAERKWTKNLVEVEGVGSPGE